MCGIGRLFTIISGESFRRRKRGVVDKLHKIMVSEEGNNKSFYDCRHPSNEGARAIHIPNLHQKIVNHVLYDVCAIRIHPRIIYLDCVVCKVSLFASFKADINPFPAYFTQA